jgi:DNA repair protein RadA/Sms
MAKKKTAFFCQNCGTQSPKWLGKCPSCGEWNTFVEEVLAPAQNESWEEKSISKSSKSKPITIKEIEATTEPRLRPMTMNLTGYLVVVLCWAPSY